MKRFALPVALVVVAGGLYLLLTRDSGEPRLPAPTRSPTTATVTEIVFSQGKELFVLDVETGQIAPGATMPTTDFDISSDGEKWAATDGKPIKRNPDPNVQPTEIIVGEVDGGAFAPVGIGYSPVWSPDAEDIAAVVPAEGYLICPFDVDPEEAQADPAEAGCTEGERVVFYAAETREERIALGGGAWEIVGWTGAERIAAYSLETNDVKIGFANATSEQQTEALVPRDAILALSPIESVFLTSNGKRVEIVEPDGTPVQEVGRNFEAAAWSPEGDLIAAVTSSGAAIIDVAEGTSTEIDAADPTSTIVWSQDGGFVAFMQRSPKGVEVVLCPASGAGCTSNDLPGGAEVQALR